MLLKVFLNMLIFPGQREGEEVLSVIRKHSIIFFKIILAFLLVIVVPISVSYFAWFRFFPINQYFERGAIFELALSIIALYGLLFTCIKWINEEFDVFIVTTDRLIDITQTSFFNRSVTSTPLEHIQDTTGKINGFLPTLFQYGDVTVQTAGASVNDIFIDHVHDPEGVARMIIDYAHKKRAKLRMDSQTPQAPQN